MPNTKIPWDRLVHTVVILFITTFLAFLAYRIIKGPPSALVNHVKER